MLVVFVCIPSKDIDYPFSFIVEGEKLLFPYTHCIKKEAHNEFAGHISVTALSL